MSGSHGLADMERVNENGFFRLSMTTGEFLSPGCKNIQFYKMLSWTKLREDQFIENYDIACDSR